jgi:glyoxylase-like metal-dependent hydrolase (beta-lactamase superfamily II)
MNGYSFWEVGKEKMTVIHNMIHQLTVPTPYAVGDVHVYLLKGDTLSLVDAGVNTQDAWDALVVQLREIGYEPNDIEQIILTHHHPDHTGLIERFSGVQHIIGHQNIKPWITRDEKYFNHFEDFYYQYFTLTGVPKSLHVFLEKLRAPLKLSGKGDLTASIVEGDRLPGHAAFRVTETKGHAQSHLSFFNDEDGTFIGGDHLLQHISPNPIMEPPLMGETERPKPLLQYRDNVTKCLDLNIRVVLPGHGEIFSSVEETIAKQRAKQEARANKVLGLLRNYSQTPFQLCEQIFSRQYKSQLDLTMSETVGQLDYLEDKGLVIKTIEDGVFVYHAV